VSGRVLVPLYEQQRARGGQIDEAASPILRRNTRADEHGRCPVSPSYAGDQPFAELRLAVAFTGGVSLAVWMAGIAREINLLLAASRAQPGEQVVGSISPESQQVRDGYQRLLQLLKTECTPGYLVRHQRGRRQRGRSRDGQCPGLRLGRPAGPVVHARLLGKAAA
jgi:hypothetical protein